jgi:hypothetical protein
MPPQWRCHRSGDCCRNVGAVAMTHAERAAIEQASARALRWRDSATPGFVELVGDPACPLLGADGGCTVYAARPFNCRRWGCFRPTTDEPLALAVMPNPDAPAETLPVRLLTSRPVARQWRRMTEAAMPWALAHGWVPPARDDR